MQVRLRIVRFTHNDYGVTASPLRLRSERRLVGDGLIRRAAPAHLTFQALLRSVLTCGSHRKLVEPSKAEPTDLQSEVSGLFANEF